MESVTAVSQRSTTAGFQQISYRTYQSQTPENRVCEFYAVATAFSLCLGIDPSGFFYDKKLMPGYLQKCLSTMKVELFPHVPDLIHPEVIK